jgi:hypothetical protein
MRAKWDNANGGLKLHTAEEGWVYVGWVEERKFDKGFRVLCCWLDDPDYPENTVFDTLKQARRALKDAATVAIIGGFTGRGT